MISCWTLIFSSSIIKSKSKRKIEMRKKIIRVYHFQFWYLFLTTNSAIASYTILANYFVYGLQKIAGIVLISSSYIQFVHLFVGKKILITLF